MLKNNSFENSATRIIKKGIFLQLFFQYVFIKAFWYAISILSIENITLKPAFIEREF